MNEQHCEAARALEASGLLPSSLALICEWLGSEHYTEYHAEVIALIEQANVEALNDAFYQRVEFGTGGMRGMMGLGPARINKRTLGEATEALAQYLDTFGDEAKNRGVVLCHEVRHSSREYVEYLAGILMAHGIKVFVFESFRATPELSFSVPHLNAFAGVMVSASHNPSTDNGYKVYWNHGEQVVNPHASEIMGRVPDVFEIKHIGLDEGKAQGLYAEVGEEVDNAYVQAVLDASLPVPEHASKLNIAYSPFHGAGQTSTLKVLRAAGFDVHVVDEQMTPDGSFPSVNGGKPNPEDPKAFDLVLSKAKEVNADVVMTNDPDADRVGVAVKADSGEYVFLTGNQAAVLICSHFLSSLKRVGELPEKGVVVKTMVTTDMLTDIVNDYSVRAVTDLLVGFKYIAGVMMSLGDDEKFLMGAEESLGYLIGTYAYDKDGASGALMLAHLILVLKEQGKNILRYLDELYAQYGYYKETLESIYFEGASGKETMDTMMDSLRKDPPTSLGEFKVYRVVDRSTGDAIDPSTGKVLENYPDLDQGNVLVFELSEDGRTKATIRPSGTEPKVKYYIACKGDVSERKQVDVRAKEIGEALMKLAESFV